MTKRRKSVPCGLCKLPTFDSDGVCKECRAIYAEGQQCRHAMAASAVETKVYRFGGASIIHAKRDYAPVPDRVPLTFGLLIQRILAPFVVPEALIAGSQQHHDLYWLPQVTSEEVYTPWFYLRLSEDQQLALHDLVRLIQSIAHSQRKIGEADGRNFLFGLATGKTSIDDYNRLATRNK